MNPEQNDNKIVDKNLYSAEVPYDTKKPKLKLILIIVGVLVLLGVIAYLVFFTGIFKKKASDSGGVSDANKAGQNIKQRGIAYPSLRVNKDDLDNDGLLDTEEEKLGTSNSEFDTDWDGIPDKLEVEKYKTDPTKTDSDGDGFSDGYEISNGYNPLGEGRL